jgi:hypothetical protein
MKPRYFRGTNLYIPDPYWWIDPMTIAGIFMIDIIILSATILHIIW